MAINSVIVKHTHFLFAIQQLASYTKLLLNQSVPGELPKAHLPSYGLLLRYTGHQIGIIVYRWSLNGYNCL